MSATLTDTIAVRARAKINLALHVTGRRDDGYHLLDSLVVFADIADTVQAARAQSWSLDVTGPFAPALAGEASADNLVIRAGKSLAAASGDPSRAAALVLDKVLPVASGIGGGSADAAATLHALSRLWHVRLPEAELHALALGLGADVPVCLAGQATRMRGIGEILEPVPPLPAAWLVLVNAGLPVSTPAVFRARAQRFSPPLDLPSRFADAPALASWLAAATMNDLEAPARAICPVIGDVLAALAASEGCLFARMSGSGGTCFGLYADAGRATRAAGLLGKDGWWAQAGAVVGGDAN